MEDEHNLYLIQKLCNWLTNCAGLNYNLYSIELINSLIKVKMLLTLYRIQWKDFLLIRISTITPTVVSTGL